MIDARECEAMARQCEEAAGESLEEADRCKRDGMDFRADRWRRAATALNDAAEAFHRAANEIEAVSTER